MSRREHRSAAGLLNRSSQETPRKRPRGGEKNAPPPQGLDDPLSRGAPKVEEQTKDHSNARQSRRNAEERLPIAAPPGLTAEAEPSRPESPQGWKSRRVSARR